MDSALTSQTVGRIAGWLFIGSGALSLAILPLPQPGFVDRRGVLVSSLIGIAFGVAALFLPWQRWPRRASLLVLPLAFALIGTANYFGSSDPYSYSLFFVVAFAWLGISHPRWTSLWFAVPAVIGYGLPILLRPDGGGVAAASAGLAIPVCVSLAELLAWVSQREFSSRQRASALSRVARALGPHLENEELCEVLVHETRMLLRAEHAALYQLDPDEKTIKAIFTSGIEQRMTGQLKSLIGLSYAASPGIAELLAGRPVIIDDTSQGRHEPRGIVEAMGLKSYMAVPIVARGALIGVLSCADSSHRRRYDRDDLALARAVASQASTAFENALLYEQTIESARRDALTTLPNRRSFQDRLATELARAARDSQPLSLVLVDIDGFKRVNDKWGHRAGDRVLVRMAASLEHVCREHDAAFRIGGDEFAIILPRTTIGGGASLAEHTRHRVERAEIGPGDSSRVTVSIGVAAFPDHAVNLDELFERADTALYEVKWSGGNAVALAPSAGPTGPGVKFGVDIQAVIESKRLVSLYQPIVDLGTGRVNGYEAFCRLDPALGSTPTPTLFRAAGALGLVEVLDRTCRDIGLRGAIGLPPDVLLFLNVAPAALESPQFSVTEILDAAGVVGLDPRRIVVEVIEHERTPESLRLAANLESCREAGLKIALDDLGSSGGDLELLARIPFDFVKIDMSFVQGADVDGTRRRLLQGLGLLVAKTGAYGIAEGVETAEDYRLVTELGFQGAQGYYVSRPSRNFEAGRVLEGATSRLIADPVKF